MNFCKEAKRRKIAFLFGGEKYKNMMDLYSVCDE
jgi:hypothetical protein